MSDSALRRALLAALGRRPTPSQRRQIAAELEALAQEQRQIAEAVEREARKPAAERLTPRKATAGPGRTPGDFVRIERTQSRTSTMAKVNVYIGRDALRRWRAVVGDIRHVGIAREHGHVTIACYDPRRHSAPYTLDVRNGQIPRIRCDALRDLLPQDGRYSATIEAGAIVLGPLLPS